MKSVRTEWKPIQEWVFEFKCPYCKKSICDHDLCIDEGDEFNGTIKCPHCKSKMRLKVEE